VISQNKGGIPHLVVTGRGGTKSFNRNDLKADSEEKILPLVATAGEKLFYNFQEGTTP